MKIADKLVVFWLAVMWIIFSTWVVAVAPFPLNFGFVAFQLLTGLVFVWMMIPNKT